MRAEISLRGVNDKAELAMAEIASSLIAEAVRCIFHLIKRPISYAFLHKKKLKSFEEKVERLKERKNRVENDVDAAERNGEKIHPEVSGWLSRAANIIDAELKEVKDLEGKAKNKCFIGLCPNFKSRYQLIKKAEEEAKIVHELLQQADGFNEVSYRVVPRSIEVASLTGFEAFDSREQVFNDILKALKDPRTNSIGVYGMPGVGKTTLVRKVASQVEEDKLFDRVVFAAVTQTPDIRKIQGRIAESLGLKLEEQSTGGRASRLFERLKKKENIFDDKTEDKISDYKKEKILVVLDDIWPRFDLVEVGIPFGDEHMGCTVLLTSRDRNVLQIGIGVQQNFPIGALNGEEAWDLFKKTAGNSVESPELRPTATKIAEKCAGLPIAISTIATTLRNQPLFAWKDALLHLNKPSPSNFCEVPAVAYSAIEWSYINLESEELKQIFLLCGLLGHDFPIESLLKYAMGLRLFHVVGTVEEARNRLLTVVSNLKAFCLLLDSYSNRRVDMHDLISDVAISIASKDNRVFSSRRQDVPIDWPDSEIMKGLEKISLDKSSISELPDKLKCPELSFFYLWSKDPSMKIPNNFFKETKSLKVLDLTGIHFSSLPSSIGLLANLRTLCLHKCVLGDIAIIGELKNLEILSLFDSDIERLPEELGQLIKLKMLDISECTRLKMIPPNVISSLSRLEELCIEKSFSQWEVEEHLSQRSNASLAELKALSRLTSLDVHIPNAKIIPKDLFFEKLQKYKILIGEEWDWDDEIECSKTLKLKLHTSIGYLAHGMKILLMKAENVYVDEMEGLENLLHKSEGGEWFQQLKNLCIQNGALIQYIIKDNDVGEIEFLQLQSLTLHGLPRLISFCSQNNGSTSISPQPLRLPLFNEKILFPKLENLKLSSISIESIWQHQHPRGSYSFQSLTSIVIEGCCNLKHVLSYSMAVCLQQLQCLEIIDCNSMQEIISMEEIVKEEYGSIVAISFLRLNTLKLKGLQKLIGFCHGDYIVEFQSLKILHIEQCSKMKGFIINKSVGKDISTSSTDEVLFNEKVVFPNLEKMTISHLRNVKRIWYNQIHGDSFCKLKELEVEHCDELLNVLSSFLLGVFRKLETLKVKNCGSLEEVFELYELDIKEASGMAIQLRELYIYHLPKLKHVWNKDPNGYFSFQNLRVVDVRDCGSLKSLFPFTVAKGLSHLETLDVNSCGVEEIVSKNIEGLQQEIRFEFNHLSYLSLWNLRELRCFYPGVHIIVSPALKWLRGYECEKIKIFGQEESQIQPLFLVKKVFPQLEEVFFSNDEFAMICDGRFPADLFGRIKVLGIYGYLNESAVFPFHFLQRFYNLEMLVVAHYHFKELSPYEGDVDEQKDMIQRLPKIKKLHLSGLYKITHLWKQGSQLDHICENLGTLEVRLCNSLINLASASSSFKNLTTLDVWDCNRMTELIASSNAQSLVCLVTMKIRECEMMTEIVAGEGDEATYEIIFRELKYLKLDCLKRLRSFYSGKYTFKFPSLEEVYVSRCPRLRSFCKGALCTTKLHRIYYLKETDYKGHWAGDLNATIEELYEKKVGYHGLKQLKFSEFPELVDIWNRNPREMLDFKILEFLEVCDSNLRCIFSISMALSLGRLQQIEIKRCNKMEQVIVEEEGSIVEEATTDDKIIIFPMLKSIFIEFCPDLTSFYLGSQALECPSLEEIKVAFCPNITTSVFALSRDKDKESIIGDGTKRDKDDPDTALAFFSNKIISMEEIVKEEYGSKAAISFLRLNTLKLKGLQKLIGFCHGDYIVEFQSLKILHIEQCTEMKGFIVNKSMGKDISTSNTDEVLFNEKVVFPNLEKMTISHLRNVKRIWYNQIYGDSFCKLKELEVEHCDELLNVLSSFLLGVFPKLEMLKVNDCNSLEEVFELHELDIKEASGMAIQLRELCISYLPKLKRVWNKDPNGNFSFQNLQVVDVSNCGSLKSLFPFSVAKGLLHLETLKVTSCGVEEIVSKNIEGLQQEIRFEFNHLSFLSLGNLPELGCFYPGVHTIVSPALKKLRTYLCRKIKIFGQEETQIQPLFLVEKVFPQLDEVWLSSDEIEMICDGQFSADLFDRVKVLGIQSYLNESAVFPFYFLQRFHILETLEVGDCRFKELSPYEGDVDEQKDMIQRLPKIKKLNLNGLHKITHLWKQGSQLDHICENLGTLGVYRCDSLINLASAYSSFKNLTTLEVWFCNGMTELIASPNAQSLVCLVKMTIVECEMMTEIVASEGDNATNEIILRELKTLVLYCLKSLRSFCSGKCAFKFPSLENVIVFQCPKLKSFCRGALSTPKLETISYRKNKAHWAGDLNATIEELYEKKVGYHGLKQLKFSESPELMDIWNRNPQKMLDFKILEFLEVCDSNLRCIFSISMALSLGRLQQMVIKRCNKMEQVIMEEEEATTDDKIIIFPMLKSIFIEFCPDLTSFYLASQALECPSLEEIEVAYCPNITTFVSAVPRDKEKEAVISDGTERHEDDPDILTAFLCDKVVFPMLRKLHIHDLGNLKKIWYDQVAADSLFNLEDLLVQRCHKLLHIFPFNMSEKLHKLKDLEIIECDSVEEVFEPQRMNVEESHVVATTQSNAEFDLAKFVFPQVTYLKLSMLPNLKSFYHKIHATEWPSLKKMLVFGCDKVEIFASEYQNFQNTIGQSQLEIQVQPPLFLVDKVAFPCLEELRLEGNDIMKVIWHGRFPGEFFCGLKVLELIGFPHQAASLSYCFIPSLPILEKLVVSDASFSHIFHCEGLGGEEHHALALACLSELRLSNLPHLTDIWDEEFHPKQAFYNLRILEVQDCGKLKILVPSSVSFQNLTSLVIERCNGLINLLTHSMAKSLVQLTTMRIIDCRMIEKIIACSSDEVKDGIVFAQLKYLELCYLPNLENFCSGYYAIGFPSLEEIKVADCPNMTTFVSALSTDKDKGAIIGDGIERNKDDPDTLIAFFCDKVVFPMLKKIVYA